MNKTNDKSEARRREAEERVIDAIKSSGIATISGIAHRTRFSKTHVTTVCLRLRRRGIICQVGTIAGTKRKVFGIAKPVLSTCASKREVRE